MSEKEKLLEYIKKPKIIYEQNRMGCSENWYNSYFAMMATFTKEEIQSMSNKEIENLLKLADNIAEGLY